MHKHLKRNVALTVNRNNRIHITVVNSILKHRYDEFWRYWLVLICNVALKLVRYSEASCAKKYEWALLVKIRRGRLWFVSRTRVEERISGIAVRKLHCKTGTMVYVCRGLWTGTRVLPFDRRHDRNIANMNAMKRWLQRNYSPRYLNTVEELSNTNLSEYFDMWIEIADDYCCWSLISLTRNLKT